MVQNLKLTAHTTFLLTLTVVEQNAFYNHRVNLAACVFEAIENGDEEGAKKAPYSSKTSKWVRESHVADGSGYTTQFIKYQKVQAVTNQNQQWIQRGYSSPRN